MELESNTNQKANGDVASNGGSDSKESSVERELNGEIEAVELNGGPSNGHNHIKKPLPVGDGHDGRIKRKAKRLIQRQNSGSGSGSGTSATSLTNGVATAGGGVLPSIASTTVSSLANGILPSGTGYVVPHRRWKNSRRSRNLTRGRGLPKKGGAGGKGVWGLPGSEALAEVYEDENDPNYDSEVNDRNVELREVITEITPEEFFKLAEPIVLEYYEHGDTHEVAVSFDEILQSPLREYITSILVEIAMDHKDSQREMTSVLISDLYGRVITGKDIEKGFNMVLANLPDLILDTPEAPVMLGNFMARAIADDCMPPKFVSRPEEHQQMNEYAEQALRRADALLHKQVWAHLDNVWGMGGPLRPVKTITKQMTLLLKEYLSSRDVAEAQRCLRALEVPHYHHELVYEAVVMTLESLSQTTEEAMCELLKSLDLTCLVLPAGMEQGFMRVFDDMADIVLDVPLAYIILDRFVERCNRAGFLTDKIINNVPSRGRKRFVSEGDGGHVKPATLPMHD
ncbi:PREDICTED: programmed cell death protein 4 [Drosophila arizonae]|uniref:Programmed cell death protein 4 n=1 Tax=Drosophila arizonae TaxID=7263 RepID=A0ABM1PYB0_DROAR|nr:PREDICTED: programmed cell death protein 4 [Drosophila arizonae]XP_017872196.1 PREDICTED: programmed cell death protein 4 [Drosophila arizonae]